MLRFSPSPNECWPARIPLLEIESWPRARLGTMLLSGAVITTRPKYRGNRESKQKKLPCLHCYTYSTYVLDSLPRFSFAWEMICLARMKMETPFFISWLGKVIRSQLKAWKFCSSSSLRGEEKYLSPISETTNKKCPFILQLKMQGKESYTRLIVFKR